MDPPTEKPNEISARISKKPFLEDRYTSIDRPNIDYPNFAYRPHGWKEDLALANASSMVSELAPIVLYLRYMIKPGNVLIVEEPESHLHPAMQVTFTRQLAALVEAGIRVIVTTHSEWLSRNWQTLFGVLNFPRPNVVTNLRFAPTKWAHGCSSRSNVPKVGHQGNRLDDSGLYPSGYDEIASALHNEWADISSRIEAAS